MGLVGLEGKGQTTIISENFNSGIPSGWGTTNYGSCVDGWTPGNYFDIDGTPCAFALSYDTVTVAGCVADAVLESDFFDGSSFSTLTLEFDHVFADWSPSDSGVVRLYDGNNFNVVAKYELANSGHKTIDITQYKSSVMSVDFEYYGNDDDAWGIDNFKVSGTLTASVNENRKSLVSVSPNPSDGQFMISGTVGKTMVRVFDMVGQVVLNQALHSEGPLDLRHLNPGVYSIEINFGQGAHTSKIIKR